MTMNHKSVSSNPVKKTSKTAAILVAGALLGVTALTTLTSVLPMQPANAESVLNRSPKQGFADLVEKVMPTVVSVEVRFAPVVNKDRKSPFSFKNGDDQFSQRNPFEFFDRFSKGHGKKSRPPSRKGRASGSGFIISEDGYIITNNHVVKDATEVVVKLSDGEEFKATVVGKDSKTDLAVLKLKSNKKFQFAKLADKDPRVGDWVVAVGNPFGLGGTVTTGIVSASGRNIGSGPYDNFLQIDASINKGNSGGPAFNLNGEVIGVNTAIYSPSGGSVGIGFAIPASTTKRIVADLISKGSVTRGWLGVQIQAVSKDIADSLGLKKAVGTLVSGVNKNSPAEKSGLKTGDTIISVDGEKVKGPRELAVKIAGVKPGQVLDVEVIRKGKSRTVKVTIGVMPGAAKLANLSKPVKAAKSKLASLGLAVETAENGRGLVVRAVARNGAAAKKGIRRGDVIIEVDGIDIDDPETLKSVLKRSAKAGNETILFLLRSADRQRFVALPLKAERS